MPVKATSLDWRWNQARTPPAEPASAPWDAIAARARGLSGVQKLTFVNGWINNNIRFIEDGNADHWASAAETFRKGTGDCEDFAIAKMTVLQAAGVPEDSMYLVIVRDTVRNRDHAVLAARTDGQMLVLDSRTDRILPSDMITDYRPSFTFGGQFAWTHGYQRGTDPLPGR